MKVDFQQQQNDAQIDYNSYITSASTASTTPTAMTTPSLSSCTDEKPENYNDDNNNTTIVIVPFEPHRQEEVVTLFQNGLLSSYDFTGNDAWKLLNEWFVADRLTKEMKDVYTGFNMAATAATTPASKHAAADSDASFEGLHFMTAIDTATDKVVGCVGIKRPDQHTLALLRQSAAKLSKNEKEGSDAAIILKETTTTCELVRLSVDQTCRRRGIGQKLVQAVEHFAKLHGYQRVCLCTLQVQRPAVALYQSCGYSLVQEEALDYIPTLPQEYLSGGKDKIMSLVYLCKQLDYQ